MPTHALLAQMDERTSQRCPTPYSTLCHGCANHQGCAHMPGPALAAGRLTPCATVCRGSATCERRANACPASWQAAVAHYFSVSSRKPLQVKGATKLECAM